MNELSCNSCKHWHQLPAPAPTGGVVMLKAEAPPVLGECRERLSIFPTQQGMVTFYPQTSENWAACGQYKAKE